MKQYISYSFLSIYDPSSIVDPAQILQYKFFLLQKAGINLGLHYQWTFRGPRCEELRLDIKSDPSLLSLSPENIADVKVKPAVQKQIDLVNKTARPQRGLSVEAWCTLLGTIVYLSGVETESFVRMNSRQVRKVLIKHVSRFDHFDEIEVEAALSSLEWYFFLEQMAQ